MPDVAATLAEASRPRTVRRLIMNGLLPVAEDEETTLHRRLHSALRGADHPDRATGAPQTPDARAAWTARDFLVSPDRPRALLQRMVHADASPDGNGLQLSALSREPFLSTQDGGEEFAGG